MIMFIGGIYVRDWLGERRIEKYDKEIIELKEKVQQKEAERDEAKAQRDYFKTQADQLLSKIGETEAKSAEMDKSLEQNQRKLSNRNVKKNKPAVNLSVTELRDDTCAELIRGGFIRPDKCK
jgi:ABC-type Fe3+-citrate transport system substrate-binding protein